MKKKLYLFVVIMSCVTANVFASADIDKGKLSSASCAACHGVDGNSTIGGNPKLAGQSQGYLLKQLRDFKSGARKDTTMNAMVAPLSDADMINISAYYATQKITQGATKNDTKMIALGQRIYRGGDKEKQVTACTACHGPQGQGIPSAKFPAIASQSVAYIQKQLKDFRQYRLNKKTGSDDNSRSNDYEGMMRSASENLTNKEIEAVAQYIAGLH